MEYAKNLRFHKDISNHDEILSILNDGKSIRNIYLICINKKTKNLMDIIESIEFTKKIFSLNNYIIIGVAKGKKNAFSLVGEILEEYYLKTKSFYGFRRQFFTKRKR